MTDVATLTAAVRELIAETQKQWDERQAELDKLSVDGDVPFENLYEWDRLRYDVHAEQDEIRLGEVHRRLVELFGEPEVQV